MSRPMLLVFLLLILIITSQFEWRQQLVNDIDSTTSAAPGATQKQLQISKREEAVKEKAQAVYGGFVLYDMHEGRWKLGGLMQRLFSVTAEDRERLKLFRSSFVFLPSKSGIKRKETDCLIILSQEKNIHRLNELIRNLQQQLLQCRCINETTNGTVSSFTEHALELELRQTLED